MTNEQLLEKQAMKDIWALDTPDIPTPLTEEVAILRANLIMEEALETITKGLGLSVNISFKQSHNNYDEVYIDESLIKNENLEFSFNKVKEVNLKELADGLADLHVVGYCGTGVVSGIDMEPIYKEVNRSNNSKLWDSQTVAENSQLIIDSGWKVESTEKEGIFRVRRADGKVIKSPNYSEADIKSIIDKQINNDYA